jgi:hypothetical protein
MPRGERLALQLVDLGDNGVIRARDDQFAEKRPISICAMRIGSAMPKSAVSDSSPA